jgi:hypothetical protein
MDAEGAGHLADGFSFLEQPLGEIPLVGIHFFGSSEADASLLSVCAACTGALTDEVSLELGDSGEDSHNHLAGVRGGIGPRLRDRLEASTSIADRFHDLEQIAGGAGQPVELPDGDDIALAKLVEHPVQLWPVTVGSGDLLAEDSFAACLLERFELKSQPLIFGGNAGVA